MSSVYGPYLDEGKRSQCLVVIFWLSSYTWEEKREANKKGELYLPEKHWECKAILWSNFIGSHLLSTPITQHFICIISFPTDKISMRNALSFFHDEETEGYSSRAGI